MDLEQPVIRISVRNLVEFILRAGDIDNRIASTDKDTMQLGSRIHRKIQKQMVLNTAITSEEAVDMVLETVKQPEKDIKDS